MPEQQVGPTPVYVFSESGERINIAAVHPLLAAAEMATYEIGVPNGDYPANIANAYRLLTDAIAEARGSGEAAP